MYLSLRVFAPHSNQYPWSRIGYKFTVIVVIKNEYKFDHKMCFFASNAQKCVCLPNSARNDYKA